ncbi:TetR/AcrR family transcriptional regulator [uncultured Jatrophihabitans sp.]|uniref:TetR/AcrR family transcriptional regulator n=1 Tax=uncultured Jatrophihabitans sp. TaxID=1610747 RepID=UPI0035CC3B59
MRRDAARNYERVLAAAREVLDEHGTDATIELIASRAGVGVGTVYRSFPTKEALVDELVRQIFTDLVAAARKALTETSGTGLRTLLFILGRAFTKHRGYAHLLVDRAPAECGAEVLRGLIAELLDDAQANGQVAADITLGDVLATIWAIRGIVESSGTVTPRAWQRHLDLQLRAFSGAGGASQLPPLSAQQLNRITAGGPGAVDAPAE